LIYLNVVSIAGAKIPYCELEIFAKRKAALPVASEPSVGPDQAVMGVWAK
jgi:hypothetical protein